MMKIGELLRLIGQSKIPYVMLGETKFPTSEKVMDNLGLKQGEVVDAQMLMHLWYETFMELEETKLRVEIQDIMPNQFEENKE